MAQALPEVLTHASEAIDRVRLSRAKTQHAIDRSRRSISETLALLMELRRAREAANRATLRRTNPPRIKLARVNDWRA